VVGVKAMPVPGATKLAELCSDHYHGLLTTETYRSERAQLLRDVLNGTTGQIEIRSVSATDDRELPRDSESEHPEPTATQFKKESLAVAKPKSVGLSTENHLKLPIALGCIVILLFIGIGVWMYFSSADRQAAPQTIAETDTALKLEKRNVATEFLAKNDWTEDGIAGFLYELDQMLEKQRTNMQRLTSYQSLIRELRDRIIEERALGLAGGVDYQGMTLLEAFAAELGLNVGSSVATDVSVQTAQVDESADTEVPIQENVATESFVSLEAAESVAIAVPESENRAGQPDQSTAGQQQTVIAAPTEAQQRLRQARERKAEEAAENAVLEAVQESVAGTAGLIASDRPCVAGGTTRRKTCWDMLSIDVRGPVMVLVPSGTYTMGSETDAVSSPSHEVTIENSFALSAWEISFDQYNAFCGLTGRECPINPWGSNGEMPVVNVSWRDANDYANWLSDQTGALYRLASEAEWEYAARGGTSSRYPFGDELSIYDARFDSGDGTETPVSMSDKKTERNGFQLWHVVGNVREWTLDGWQGGYSDSASDAAEQHVTNEQKVVRGGSWGDGPESVTSTARIGLQQSAKDAYTGIRLLRELPAY